MHTKRGFILVELLICITILCLVAALLILALNGGCSPAPNSGNAKIKGWIPSIGTCVEFNYDGCQYIQAGRGISHKGNCTNTLHQTKRLEL